MSNNNSSSAPFDFNTFLQKSDQTPTGPMKSTPSHPGTSLPVSQNQKVVHYNTSANTVPEAPQPTATLPIAHYTSTEPGFPYSGSLIAVNQQYICYVTKGGLIRVIDRRNAARTLLRGHGAGKTVKNTQIVYDLQFFSSSSDVLATVGGIGETGKSGVIVWRIFSTVGNMESIQSEKMLQINFPANRLVWHPFTPNIFLVLRENNSTGYIDKDNSSQLFEAVQIETTKLLTLSHPTEGHAVCDAFLPSPSGENNPSGDTSVADIIQPLFGARMRGHNGALTDVCWSQDATQAFTCDTEGVVKVWDLTMASHTTDKLGTILVTCVLTVQAENPGVSLSRVFSLPNFNLSQGMAPRRDFVPSFVSTSESNTKVTLWAPTLQMNEFPQKLQTIVFDQTQVEQPLRFNSMHCNCLGPNTSGELHFFMFSDKTNGRLYSVHLAKSGNRFDFVTPFKLLHPVFSWSSLVSALDVQEFLDLSGEELSRNPTGQAQPGSEISLFCVQDKAVQQIKLLPSICFPSYAESVSVSYAVSLNDEKADNDDFQAEEYDLGDDVIEEEVPETDHNVVTSGLPPGLDIFPAEQKSDEASGGAFSNWLGSIISGKAAIPEPIKAVSPSPAPIIGSEQNNGSSGHLLTPEEVMSKHVNQESIPDLEKNKDSAESKLKETSDMKQPKAVKKQPKSRDATPPPVGKISILKREDKQISVESLSKTAISGDGDLEALLNKVVSSSLKRRDAQLHAEIQKTIKNEINESVIPALGKCVTQTIENTVTKPLQVALANKSKEGSQLKTKEVVKAITESMSKPVSDAFENSMRNVMIPAYEVATNQMFSQISTCLETGLSSSGKDETQKTIETMSTLMQSMMASIESLTDEVKDLRAALSSKDKLPSEVPDEHTSLKDKILSDIKAHNFEGAFTTALSANNAEMTVFACKHSDISSVLDEDNLLVSQAILLCLMQQLSASLVEDDNSDPVVELEWLQEIAVVLKPQDPSINAHATNVLRQAGQNISAKSAMGDVPRMQKRQLQTLLQVLRGLSSY